MDNKAQAQQTCFTRMESSTPEDQLIPQDTQPTMPADYFCRQSLELSFRLLRNKSPLLAHALKIALDNTPAVNMQLDANTSGEVLLNTNLLANIDAHTIGQIVSVLTDLIQQALTQKDLPPSHMALLRTLIEDWVQLTEWILAHSAADTSDMTSYH